jgi:hypothetical protein
MRSVEFAGALLRPYVDWLVKNDEKAKEIFDSARQVGFQNVREGKMSKNRLNIICQQLISNKDFLSKMRRLG